LKDEGNKLYQANHHWAAVNLYNFALSHPDKTLDDSLKMILHANASLAYNSLKKKKYGEAALNHIEEAIFLCEETKTEKQHMNKFILRKARALSFNMYTIEEGLKCI